MQHVAYQANNQCQEAEAIWQMAKDLGVTCGNVQTNYVQQLIKMEDRDTPNIIKTKEKSKIQHG